MSKRDAFTYTLQHPITLPDGEVTELKFPRMKGKYMRQFQARQRAAEAADEGAETSVEYDQFMAMAERMLADNGHGPVSAHLILDEMDPDDVHQVVALVGERFAGGRATGATA